MNWAIIAGHPSLCHCPECMAMRIVYGYEAVSSYLPSDLFAEARNTNLASQQFREAYERFSQAKARAESEEAP